eukprot:scaffold2102_cov161-Amphora_coffeaeformis.AAC.36
MSAFPNSPEGHHHEHGNVGLLGIRSRGVLGNVLHVRASIHHPLLSLKRCDVVVAVHLEAEVTAAGHRRGNYFVILPTLSPEEFRDKATKMWYSRKSKIELPSQSWA